MNSHSITRRDSLQDSCLTMWGAAGLPGAKGVVDAVVLGSRAAVFVDAAAQLVGDRVQQAVDLVGSAAASWRGARGAARGRTCSIASRLARVRSLRLTAVMGRPGRAGGDVFGCAGDGWCRVVVPDPALCRDDRLAGREPTRPRWSPRSCERSSGWHGPVVDTIRRQVRRPARGHLTFSHGAHHCLGVQLDRMALPVELRPPGTVKDRQATTNTDSLTHGHAIDV